jgi:peptide/nickel transport system permease protein
MLTFLLRRLVSLPPLLLVISFLTYLLLQFAPGDFYSRIEQDPKYTFDYAMRLRHSVGRVVAVAPESRAEEIGPFESAGRHYSFSAKGGLLLDGKPADPKLELAHVRRFSSPKDPETVYSVTDAGAVYRYVSKFRGYVVWLGNVLRGNLGDSWSQSAPVLSVMWTRMGNTLLLEVVALIVAWSLAIPLGVWSGVKPNSLIDHVCGFIAYMSLSVPTVFLALLALLFAYATKWFPVGDMRSLDWDALSSIGKLRDLAWHVTLPALVIGLTQIAIFMRQMRGQMVETMSADYVRTARAKGVPHNTVIFKHALRNAINPLVTIFGFSLAGLLSGSFLVEVVLNWPGLARVTVDAVLAKDEPLVMASVLFAAVLLVAGNVVADLLLAIVDPKIRLE